MLNEDLFKKIKSVYDEKEALNLKPIEAYLLEEKYKNFTRSGINLNKEDKKTLKEINGKLASLTLQYGDNLLDETNAFEYHTNDSSDLGNLPSSLRELILFYKILQTELLVNYCIMPMHKGLTMIMTKTIKN